MTISSSTGAVSGEADSAAELFEAFAVASTCHGILAAFERLCDALDVHPSRPGFFYNELKSRLRNWKAESLWSKLDKRACHKDYKNNSACSNSRVLIIGAGPCGLRTAIECKLLGAKCVVVEKRDSFSRNNVLHLWPFVIHDLKSLGAKMFFPKFCAGAIDHISIRQLQCVLLKVALIFGVEVHVHVGFESLLEPDPPASDHVSAGHGWRAVVTPSNHIVSQYEFDVLIGADGKRNTLSGFPRKEFRGKLAIAITANFINHHTQLENRVEEISGVAFIFNQKFFKDLCCKTGIDLENIVYYKDDTHYFVMTAKKHSLLEKGVILEDQPDVAGLLAKENVNQQALLDYAREAADVSTNNMLPSLEFAHNGYGQADVAMFDFTSIFAAENSSRVIERNGFRLLMGIVGDSLLEPFWPTGSGCARGFLGALDAAWMVRSWASGTMTPLEVIAERESVYQLLSQTTPENLSKNPSEHSVCPLSRYPKCNMRRFKPSHVRHLYDAPPGAEVKVEEQALVSEAPPAKHARGAYDVMADGERLLRWYQRQLADCAVPVVISDLSSSWRDGAALCAILHKYLPDVVEPLALVKSGATDVAALAKVRGAITAAQVHLGITPMISAEDLLYSGERGPDALSMLSYLSHMHEVLRTLRRVTVGPSSATAGAAAAATAGHQRSHKHAGNEAAAGAPATAKKPKDAAAGAGGAAAAAAAAPPAQHRSSKLSRFFKHGKLSWGGRHRQRSSRGASGTAGEKPSEAMPSENSGAVGAKGSVLSFKGIGSKAMQQGIDAFEQNEGKVLPLRTCGPIGTDTLDSDEKADGNADGGSRAASKVTQIRNRYKEVDEQAKVAWTPPPARKVIVRDLTGSSQPAGAQLRSSDVCSLCGKRVYLVERQSAEGFFFHRTCFRCAYCNVPLRVGGYLFERNMGEDGMGKFFCSYQHLDLHKQSASARKRSYTEPDAKITIAHPGQSAQPTQANRPVAAADAGLQNRALEQRRGTLERAEFENSAEAEEEECEESQTSHNFSTLSSLEADESRWEPSDDDDDDDDDDSGDDDDGGEQQLKVVQDGGGYSEGSTSDDDTSNISEDDEQDIMDEDVCERATEAAPAKLAQPMACSSPAAMGESVQRRQPRPVPSSMSDVLRRRSNFFTEAPEPVRLNHQAIFEGLSPGALPQPHAGAPTPNAARGSSVDAPPVLVDERFINTKRGTAPADIGTSAADKNRGATIHVPRTESDSSFSISSPSSSDDDVDETPLLTKSPAYSAYQPVGGDQRHSSDIIAAESQSVGGATNRAFDIGSIEHAAPADSSVPRASDAGAAACTTADIQPTSTPSSVPEHRRRLAQRRAQICSATPDDKAEPSPRSRKKLMPDVPAAATASHLAVPDGYLAFGGRRSPSAAKEQKKSVLAGRFQEMCLQPAVPTASAEEFSDDDDGTDGTLAATCSLKILRAAQRQQRQLEMKRLHMAQEIQRHLQEVEVQQKELEERGVTIEKALRGESTGVEGTENELMKDWFNLVHQKNVLLRYESGLLVQARQLELEDRHSRLEAQLRSRMLQRRQHGESSRGRGATSAAAAAATGGEERDGMSSDELDKSILDELLEVVEQRDQLVQSLEAERLRELEEDAAIEEVMIRKGLKELSPSPYHAQSVRQRRQHQLQRRRRSGARTPRLLAVTAWMRSGLSGMTSQIDLLWATLAVMIAVALLSCILAITKLYDDYW